MMTERELSDLEQRERYAPYFSMYEDNPSYVPEKYVTRLKNLKIITT